MRATARTVVAVPSLVAAVMAATGSAAGQGWPARIEAIQSDAPDAWRAYSVLCNELAELPGREGLDVVRDVWPAIRDPRFKLQIIKSWEVAPPQPWSLRFHEHVLDLYGFVLDEGEAESSSRVLEYLPRYAWRCFESVEAGRAWLRKHRGEPGEAVAARSLGVWVEAVREADDPAALVNDLPAFNFQLRRNPGMQEALRAAGFEEALLAAFEHPAVTIRAIRAGYSMLRHLDPEKYPSARMDEFLEPFADRRAREKAAARERLLAELEVQALDGDARKRWVVHPPLGEREPELGWGLLVVAPGGYGNVDFAPFVRDTIRPAAGADYVVLQLLAPELEEGDMESHVWPLENLRDDRVDFTMEHVAEAAIERTTAERRIDPDRVWTMGWSSGGPLAYQMALRDGSVRGAFVIMSVFEPSWLAPLDGARDRAFYVLHSPTDFIDMVHPERARQALRNAGARTVLQTYEGGHGWHGDIHGQVADALRWLEVGR